MTDLDKQIFDCSLQVKKLLNSPTTPADKPSESANSKGGKLPKLNVPAFDGNLLNWQTFWTVLCCCP